MGRIWGNKALSEDIRVEPTCPAAQGTLHLSSRYHHAAAHTLRAACSTLQCQSTLGQSHSR